ncbi:hypothetical protein F4778DRAFT_460709 [Xylariomycetidae sp. FL2044]|nr:hypothetical protein F4778DRAFT_460709 [Xylariomycetidae sp. FL2044]
MAPELPGYYFDTEAGRYFKIENSRTAPSSAAWSSDNVKRRKREDKEAEAALRRMRFSKNRIRRSKMLAEPLMGGFLRREYGLADPGLPATCFARGLLNKGEVSMESAGRKVKCMYVASQHQKRGHCTVYATLDNTASLISMQVPRDKNGWVCRNLLSQDNGPPNHLQAYHLAAAQTTDIKFHEKSHQILYTSGTPKFHVRLGGFVPPMSAHQPVSYHEWKAPGDPRSKYNQSNTVAPAPSSSSSICLVGSNCGILRCEPSNATQWLNPPSARRAPGEPPNPLVDVFSIVFPQDHKDLFVFGGRPGYLVGADMRTPYHSWDALHVGSTITQIRTVNEHQVLVAGLKHKMAVFDRRFGKGGNNKNNIFASISDGDRAAIPLQTFPQYRNAAHIDIGLDYDRDSGVVAAAHDDGRVALYSVRTGRRLKSEAVDTTYSHAGPIQCIQFRNFPLDVTSSLFMGVRSIVRVYSLGVDQVEDET